MSIESEHAAPSWHIYVPTLIGACLFAAVIPWLFDGSDRDLRPVLRLLLTGGVIFFVLAQFFQSDRNISPLLRDLPYYASIGLLSGTWLVLGGLDAPGFLMLFSLPVIAAAWLSRGWTEYLVASLAGVGAAVVAFVVHPELRWKLEQSPLFPGMLRTTPEFLAGDNGARLVIDGSQLELIVSFAITMFAVAILASAFGRSFHRLNAKLDSTAQLLRENEALASTLLESAGGIEILAAPGSGRVLKSNVPGRQSTNGTAAETVVDLLDPEFPEELVRVLNAGAAATLKAVVCRNGGDSRILDISVIPMQLDGRNVLRVTVRNTTELELFFAAYEDLRVGMLLIAPGGAIVFASPLATSIFPGAEVGARAEDALNRIHDLPSGWWDIAPARQSRARIQLEQVDYIARIGIAEGSRAYGLTFVHLTRRDES